MRLHELWDEVSAFVGRGWGSTRELGDRLSAVHGGTIAQTEDVGRCGLAGQVVVLVDELVAEGRDVPERLAALAAALLLQPVVGRDGGETWPDGVARARRGAEDVRTWRGVGVC